MIDLIPGFSIIDEAIDAGPMLAEMKISDYILMFFIYSIVGWIVETTYCSLGNHRFVNRGFLTGPLCPIYGTGGIVFTVILTRFADRWYLVLILGTILADFVEYLTSFLMEKLFHARWWDYSNEILNLNGRICLKHTFYWGFATMLYIYCVQTPFVYFYSFIPQKVRYIALGIILAVFVVDLINAARNAMDVKSFMNKLSGISARLSELKTKITGSKAVEEESVSAISKELDDLKPKDFMNIFIQRAKKPRLNRMYRVYTNLRRSAEGSVAAAEDLLSEIKRHFTDEGEMY